MKKIIILLAVVLILLSGCSGKPSKISKAHDNISYIAEELNSIMIDYEETDFELYVRLEKLQRLAEQSEVYLREQDDDGEYNYITMRNE